jgi:hypothetical protein
MTDKVIIIIIIIIIIILFKHKHTVHLLIFNYISVTHPSRSQSRLYIYQSQHTFPLSLPVFGRMTAVLLLPLRSPTATNSESS